MVTKEQLLAAAKRRFIEVEVPDLGQVRMRSLTESEKTAYYAQRWDKDNKYLPLVASQRSPRLLVLVLIDADGNRIFNDEDLPAVIEMDSTVTQPLYRIAKKHCRMDEADDRDGSAEGDRDTEKKSDSVDGTSSPGNSPEPTQPGISA